MMRKRSPKLAALLMPASLFAAALPMAAATLAANAQVVMGKSVGIHGTIATSPNATMTAPGPGERGPGEDGPPRRHLPIGPGSGRSADAVRRARGGYPTAGGTAGR